MRNEADARMVVAAAGDVPAGRSAAFYYGLALHQKQHMLKLAAMLVNAGHATPELPEFVDQATEVAVPETKTEIEQPPEGEPPPTSETAAPAPEAAPEPAAAPEATETAPQAEIAAPAASEAAAGTDANGSPV